MGINLRISNIALLLILHEILMTYASSILNIRHLFPTMQHYKHVCGAMSKVGEKGCPRGLIYMCLRALGRRIISSALHASGLSFYLTLLVFPKRIDKGKYITLFPNQLELCNARRLHFALVSIVEE